MLCSNVDNSSSHKFRVSSSTVSCTTAIEPKASENFIRTPMFLPYGLHNITLTEVPDSASTCHHASFQNTFSRLTNRHVSNFTITDPRKFKPVRSKRNTRRILVGKPQGKTPLEKFPVILPKFRLPRKFRDLLHAADLRRGADGFTSPPKEGVLRIFSP